MINSITMGCSEDAKWVNANDVMLDIDCNGTVNIRVEPDNNSRLESEMFRVEDLFPKGGLLVTPGALDDIGESRFDEQARRDLVATLGEALYDKVVERALEAEQIQSAGAQP